MKSMLIWFRDRYCKYNKAAGINNMIDAHFTEAINRGIYQDDSLAVFKGCQTLRQIQQWLKRLQ
eukprot:4729838-Ditylum_brightwellii.AAC.1